MRKVKFIQGRATLTGPKSMTIAGATGETEVARHVAEWCTRAGLAVAVPEAAPGRPNVVAIARGRGGGRTLLLNAHMDTVAVAGMSDPFTGGSPTAASTVAAPTT